MAASQLWYCTYLIFRVRTTASISNLLIVIMTFERFYSIIKPHKATSFNTVKRANVTIVCIVLFSVLFHIPDWFISGHIGRLCLANVRLRDKSIGEVYYWFKEMLYFILPFIMLLVMNNVIIHTIRQRSKPSIGQGQAKGQSTKTKNTEKQIVTMLLFITFGFLILTTPIRVLIYYMNLHTSNTPQYFALLHLFYQIGGKAYYTNHGINFFLYVVSGHKFRQDLVNLFKCKKTNLSETITLNFTVSTIACANEILR